MIINFSKTKKIKNFLSSKKSKRFFSEFRVNNNLK